jgi:hypothetical protein
MIKRLWVGHRVLVIALPAIAVVSFLVASLALVGAAGGFSAARTASQTPTASPLPTESPTPEPSPTDTPYAGPTQLPLGWAYADLDGVPTSIQLAHRLPMALMVDDQAIARPQSGISSASIVYQAPADGAQDRYMMVFQEGTATDIGPIRSARPYYVYWADEYKAMLGHFGGDRQSLLWVIPANLTNMYNMDALSGTGGCPYHRISTRPGPHNAYTNTAALIGCLVYKKYPTVYQNMPTRPFKGDTDPALLPAAQSMTIQYRTGTIGYYFNPTTDSYRRTVDGKPEIDPANNQQVYARSIVIMYQTLNYISSVEGGQHAVRPDVVNVGSGKAIVIQEGKQIKATWKKKTNTSLTRFYDSSGTEISLVRGEIFIQSIPPDYPVVIW